MILLRHGESTYNLENRFAGWSNVPLSERGRAKAVQAADVIATWMRDVEVSRFHKVFTSVLQRAVESTHIVLRRLGQAEVPVVESYRLNERHYGVLEGRNKIAASREYGERLVQSWRRSYASAPPPLSADDPRHPRFCELYRDIPRDELPATESLKDAVARLTPIWASEIVPAVRDGGPVLICAHGSTARAVITMLEDLSHEQIASLNVPNGRPILCELAKSSRRAQSAAAAGATTGPRRHDGFPSLCLRCTRYLGDQSVAQSEAAEVAQQATPSDRETREK